MAAKDFDVLFAPSVDLAIQDMVDHLEAYDLPTFLGFLEEIQNTMVQTLSITPFIGAVFQGNVRMFVVRKYTFLYEVLPEKSEVWVLDMIAPGRNWR